MSLQTDGTMHVIDAGLFILHTCVQDASNSDTLPTFLRVQSEQISAA